MDTTASKYSGARRRPPAAHGLTPTYGTAGNFWSAVATGMQH